MASGFLSLKWNNHKSTFFKVLSSLRLKEWYCDTTLACDGKFYPVHKLILSTCSEYFEQVFQQTQCRHPVIILKDINGEDLEALLNYMYAGEVNVLQEKLSGLIRAAECLKIKGLAVPDEEAVDEVEGARTSRTSPVSKRRRRERNNSLPISSQDDSEIHSNVEESRDENTLVKTTEVEPNEEISQNSASNSNEAFNEVVDIKEERSESDYDNFDIKMLTEDNPTHSKIEKMSYVEDGSMDLNPEISTPSISHPTGEFSLADWSQDKDSSNYDSVNYDEANTSNTMVDIRKELNESSSNLSEAKMRFTEISEGTSAKKSSSELDKVEVHYQRRASSCEVPFSFPFPSDNHGVSSSQNAQLISSMALPFPSNHFLSKAPIHPYHCSMCVKRFPSRAALKTHTRTHTGEKPFWCQFCSYRTTQKGNLVTHLRKHTGEKPFTCKYCPMRFSSQGAVRGHIETKHH